MMVEDNLILIKDDSKELIRISMTGEVIIDDSLTLDEASKLFWDKLHPAFYGIFTCPNCGSCLAREKDKL
ncbi:MAG TPA: hypothetical protein ENH82_06765 [bacterium]|nr:hypothetical protein [bacterium]